MADESQLPGWAAAIVAFKERHIAPKEVAEYIEVFMPLLSLAAGVEAQDEHVGGERLEVESEVYGDMEEQPEIERYVEDECKLGFH